MLGGSGKQIGREGQRARAHCDMSKASDGTPTLAPQATGACACAPPVHVRRGRLGVEPRAAARAGVL